MGIGHGTARAGCGFREVVKPTTKCARAENNRSKILWVGRAVNVMSVIRQGTLTPEWFQSYGTEVDVDAESRDIAVGIIVYHYFDSEVLIGSEPLGDHILATGRVASKARQWSMKELQASMTTEEPHYGDGTYVTCHSMLSTAPYELRRHHGISVAKRRSRAVLEVLQSVRLIRIWQTGGIGIALAEKSSYGLVFLGHPEVNVLRLEYLGDNGQWTP